MSKKDQKEHDPQIDQASKITPGYPAQPIAGMPQAIGSNIDKVRDILFGSQMKEIEKKLAKLETRLIKEMSDLRNDTSKKQQEIESYFKQELESLLTRIKNEHGEREESIKGLTSEMNGLVSSLGKKLGLFTEETHQEERRLREMVMEQTKVLRSELEEKFKILSENQERYFTALDANKIDRILLANMLTEISMRLHSDLQHVSIEAQLLDELSGDKAD